ncbi:MAG: hypothetical protein KZQ59_02805 [Candidatus Thiodiazotropha sp. (ex Lucinoma aequizonata)]|nr:hypothetical protein [Candidatus Thiodiazotropha sp. (ex Lucinoma aequizonata)]MCU7908216.1 hypothetical protein [Candidatus Thiodiazotropha sp. (ex Lucinoma aequizonata)]
MKDFGTSQSTNADCHRKRLSHFQSSKINTASVTSTPLRLVKPAPLIREFIFNFFHVSANRLSI